MYIHTFAICITYMHNNLNSQQKCIEKLKRMIVGNLEE